MTFTTGYTVSTILSIVAEIIILLVVCLSEVLRSGPPTSEGPAAFSFSRFQLFLWTFVIAPLFTLHWGWNCIYGCPKPDGMINETALVLLGIASGTAVTAEIVQSAQKSSGVAVQLKMDRKSVNFWVDILTDDNGQFSIARLQHLVFTIIYIGIYITIFFNGIAPGAKFMLPVFDATAYVLMGISGGSFVFGKALHK